MELRLGVDLNGRDGPEADCLYGCYTRVKKEAWSLEVIEKEGGLLKFNNFESSGGPVKLEGRR